MIGNAYEEMEDAMQLTRSTAHRLVEHWLDALTSCCCVNMQTLDTAGVSVDTDDLDTGAGDQDVIHGTEDSADHALHGHTFDWPKHRDLWWLHTDGNAHVTTENMQATTRRQDSGVDRERAVGWWIRRAQARSHRVQVISTRHAGPLKKLRSVRYESLEELDPASDT